MTGKKKVVEETSGLAEKAEIKFSKEQLVASERFRERRYILEALLKTEELYTVKAVEGKIENYMKGKVK